MKVCKDCGVEKPHTEFRKHSKMADGHINSCKACKKEYLNSYRAKNPRTDKNSPLTTRRNAAIRRARVRDQLCGCCSAEDFSLIYLLASLGEEEFEVDHMTPIALGGLHCTSNLQILTRKDNRVKGCSPQAGY